MSPFDPSSVKPETWIHIFNILFRYSDIRVSCVSRFRGTLTSRCAHWVCFACVKISWQVVLCHLGETPRSPISHALPGAADRCSARGFAVVKLSRSTVSRFRDTHMSWCAHWMCVSCVSRLCVSGYRVCSDFGISEYLNIRYYTWSKISGFTFMTNVYNFHLINDFSKEEYVLDSLGIFLLFQSKLISTYLRREKS
jgi:hypothetical protein